MASAMVLARGVDHCRACDDVQRIPLGVFKPEHPLTSCLELAISFAPALMNMARMRFLYGAARE